MILSHYLLSNAKTGVKELINNYVNGFVYNDYNELKSIIEKLYNDKKLFEYISENAIKLGNQLKWAEVLSNYLSLYEKLQKR